ncbi:MAG: basic amino acid/polyamine antiporter, family [Sphingomonadales bacterium]|jgi:APA family basic amino acid/polyamine antiporter|nr:basic amino acid/polyamine antiporter, family [Sphingomonadales bacterium]
MAGAPDQDIATPKRKLGFVMCVALVVGNMVGSGVFLLPADLAPLGWNSVYGWLVTIAGTLCLTIVLARLARDLAGGCGPFTYPAAAFGRGIGFIVAWSYWISIWVTNATLAVAVVRNLSVLRPELGAPGLGASVAIGVIWLFTIVNCLGVRTAGGVQVVTTFLKLIPLAGAILVGAWLVGAGGAAAVPTAPEPISLAGINAAATFALFAMLGFESAMAAGDRIENPERVVPRATFIGTALTGLVYLFACSAVTLLLPAGAVHGSNAPFALFFTEYVGPGTGALVAIFAAIAALGAINGFVLLQGELPLALAQGGLFPRWFARANRYEAPQRIHILSSALATFLVLVNFSRGLAGLFQFMVLVTTSVTIIFYIAGALASVKLAREGRIGTSAGFAPIAAAGILYSLWAFYGAGIEASLWSLAMTATGVPIYFLMRLASRSSPAAAARPAASPE